MSARNGKATEQRAKQCKHEQLFESDHAASLILYKRQSVRNRRKAKPTPEQRQRHRRRTRERKKRNVALHNFRSPSKVHLPLTLVYSYLASKSTTIDSIERLLLNATQSRHLALPSLDAGRGRRGFPLSGLSFDACVSGADWRSVFIFEGKLNHLCASILDKHDYLQYANQCFADCTFR